MRRRGTGGLLDPGEHTIKHECGGGTDANETELDIEVTWRLVGGPA